MKLIRRLADVKKDGEAPSFRDSFIQKKGALRLETGSKMGAVVRVGLLRRPEHFQQKCETSTRGNQFTGLISIPL
ncbi:hypothetical protein FHW72_001250 [Ochrobactrum sp. RC6B]|nr:MULTISPECIES: hypothetical protein [Brucella/Ochrobactrum group]MBB3216179.1 hypothetical protein [Ochrobactrum sp. RC6B]